MNATFPEIVLISSISVTVCFAGYLLYKFVTRQADIDYRKDGYRLIQLARKNGWVQNPVTLIWSNRYEPRDFTTMALIQFARENYDTKKPRNKQG